ncbi:RES family NAD+ phosphorylase [Niveibacterium umoris]|uniref:RES domain-containing protein n=1 Tax=Niveibacterium umoris TaxID=1193620 RepID=A0A840BK93_9RHOO|nr:RES domain-containing protein [Niveibacterium umoris]MBB4010967.1 RES domain-containing protein [Niveibacterium umoris]
MTLTVWRLVTARFADSAFSGEGARLYGGRWNRKHVPMVYTAATQSLAMLELLVQDDPLRARYVMIPAFFPADLPIEQITSASLPDGWRELAAREHLQQIGSDWVQSGRSAVLAVPSAVIPSETNYLLNPRHADFSRIQIGSPLEFITDLRLIRRMQPGVHKAP